MMPTGLSDKVGRQELEILMSQPRYAIDDENCEIIKLQSLLLVQTIFRNKWTTKVERQK
ncbi:unnamed protein product [Cylicostephanus goldi]|uniref:Uncharacterized protein n=1 Tax=Cylicostephanus goldi TaxID=71465 RepID=A0A3P6URX7_CYLGO|nr:unnamed protein product [Cylicostephanus goldi]